MSGIKACINFCAGCRGVTKEKGKWICRDTDGKFYGFPVSGIMIAPCYKPEKEGPKMLTLPIKKKWFDMIFRAKRKKEKYGRKYIYRFGKTLYRA